MPNKDADDPEVVAQAPEVEEDDDEQGELVERPEPPKKVRKGQFLVKFVKPRFDREKESRIMGLEISLYLETDHKDKLPDEVEENWKFLKKGTTDYLDVTGIPPQTIELRLTPEDEKPLYSGVAMTIGNASVSQVEDKGRGKAEKVVRFNFVAWTELQRSAAWWALTHDNSDLWMKMKKTQASLIPKPEKTDKEES